MKIILEQYDPKDIIKFIRQSTGLTQEKFGKKINKSKHAIQSYELGRSQMKLNTFLEILKEFDIKMSIEENKNAKNK